MKLRIGRRDIQLYNMLFSEYRNVTNQSTRIEQKISFVHRLSYPFVPQRYDQVYTRNGEQSCKGNRHLSFYKKKKKNSLTVNYSIAVKRTAENG